MKKLLLLLSILTAWMHNFGQLDPLRLKLDSIFQYVDKTQVPTGYLKEYGAELMPIHCFNGLLTDSNAVADIDAFRATYTDISTAKIQVQLPAMTDLTVVNTQISSFVNDAATPIVLLYGNYASMRNDALSQNLFTVSNQRIFDVPGRTQSPYTTNTLFAAASIKKVFTNTVIFTYNPSLYYSNTNTTISTLWVDFKDGQGYKTIPLNGTVSKTYTDSSSTKLIDFKVQLSTGAFVYCHSSVDVFVTSTIVSNRYVGTDPYSREVTVPTVPGEGLGGDIMQIRYSVNNPTRTTVTPHLRKPLIYVEGYDVSGKYDILNLIKNEVLDKGEWVNLALIPNGYDFMNDLDDIAGYDLVFLNYNTLRSFEDNSKMLQHVIEWIKQDKTAGGFTEKNVIIGTSAGGILCRYTLARMTKTISSASTDTKLLITHDSPHQGANVPLAFQHFLYDLGNVRVLGKKISDNLGDLNDFYVLNTKPATAQLLKARVIDENGNVVINTFLNGANSPYQQMVRFALADNPPAYRYIATAQGSQCGIPVMQASGLPIANYDGVFAIAKFRWFYQNIVHITTKYFLTTQLNAIPSSGIQSQIEYFKYVRRISFWGIVFNTVTLKEVSRSNPVGFTDWDAAPGSTQSINDRTKGKFTAGLDKQKLVWYATPFINLRAGLSMNITQDLFSFVSTVSALDAPPGTPLNPVYIFPINGTSNTSFQKYIAQEKFSVGSTNYYNQNHTDFSARNAKWMFNEMENVVPNNLDCSNECGSTSNYSITGNNPICTPTVYSVNPLTNGVTVTWSATPLGLVSFNPVSGFQTTVSKVSSGNVTITASITSCAGGTPLTISKTARVGGYNSSDYPITGTASACKNVQIFYSTVDLPGATNYQWTWPAALNLTYQNGQGTRNLTLKTNTTTGQGTITVRVANACDAGGSPTIKILTVNNCGSFFMASPNPSSGNVNISAIQPPGLTASITTTKIYQLKVVDQYGVVKKQYNYPAGVTTTAISLNDLVAGIYTLQAFDGAEWGNRQVVKQ